ncbi:hypothetical protein L3X38_002968 [Prunus dulcis]|uniref:Uncharacterized protein n=1 Tax=Prunus dulcis TaxID=3755 RepID=A0AAD4ZKH7_PRUDU|nr:hypothetical protein L3X38_002968 [Prunus dulcis]
MGLKELIFLTRRDSKTVSEYLQCVKAIADELDVLLSDDDLIIHILNGQILLSNLNLSIEDLVTTNQINPALAITLVLAILAILPLQILPAATFLTAATLVGLTLDVLPISLVLVTWAFVNCAINKITVPNDALMSNLVRTTTSWQILPVVLALHLPYLAP